MSHANDRTLIASLGFADKDRQLSRHTLACEWAASINGARKIVANAVSHWRAGALYWDADEGKTEVHISKGEGQYRSTIGFVDVVLSSFTVHAGSKIHDRTSHRQNECGHRTIDDCLCVPAPVRLSGDTVGVEVKITPIDVASIIRQIALYRAYTPEWTWVLLADWDLTEMDVTALRREKIVPLRLGESFEVFCRMQGGVAKIVSL